ncbi:ATP-binding protein [Myceligenerans halotolerans]
MPEIYPRRAAEPLSGLVDDFRVVIVGGPRQAGKTTLLKQLQQTAGGSFITLDDDDTLNLAVSDPRGLADFGDRPRIIDEVQRGGDALVRAIKLAVDRDDVPGQFVLSGSTRFLTVPTLSESLAGRAVFLDLWPLSAAETTGSSLDAPTALFDVDRMARLSIPHVWTRQEYFDLFCAGGYPEARRIDSDSRRRTWFNGYLSTVVLRDVTDFATVQHGSAIPRLASLLAARLGSELNVSDLTSGLGLNRTTVANYLSYLEMVYLTTTVSPWFANLTSRIVKTPKVFITDSGLAAALLGVRPESGAVPGHRQAGPLTETFVLSELRRQLTTTDDPAEVYFYRDREKREIDFILERGDGSVVAIEVKASASVGPDAARHLAWLRDKLGDRFVAGYVMHLGDTVLPLGDRILSLPVSALWGGVPV